MNAHAQEILLRLREVDEQRALRVADATLAADVAAVKEYQHARFARTYDDLLAHPRYSAAARFFLEELYGPRDYSARDAQFARVVPALVRVFPAEIVETVMHLAQLHALSERLDTGMARALGSAALTPAQYGDAWRRSGSPAERERQVCGVLEVGQALDRFTRRAWLRNSLRLMRGPARAAGLGALQRFLEAGFDTFGALGGAQEFLDTVAQRERALMARLFAGEDVS